MLMTLSSVSFKLGSDDLLSPAKSSIEIIMCKGNQQLDDSQWSSSK